MADQRHEERATQREARRTRTASEREPEVVAPAASARDWSWSIAARPETVTAFEAAVGSVHERVAHANVQLRARPGAHATGDVHTTAARGVGGAGERMPHHDRIQRAFGRHDISGVRAHRGGDAAKATAALGAVAYARGNAIAFGGAPDLRTAAHEAAHVIQQRAGVSLSGGLGREGDTYERQADAVADRVVAGESVEALLGSAPASTSASATGAARVQRKEAAPSATKQGPAGQAGPVGPGGATAPAERKPVTFTDLEPTQRAQVERALQEARTLASGAIAALTDAPSDHDVELRSYFGLSGSDDARLREVIGKYRRILEGLDNAAGDLTIEGEDYPPAGDAVRTTADAVRGTKSAPPVGYVYPAAALLGFGSVHVIFPEFAVLPTDRDRAGVILHEVSHRYLLLNDSKRGIDSAHAFEDFAKLIAGGVNSIDLNEPASAPTNAATPPKTGSAGGKKARSGGGKKPKTKTGGAKHTSGAAGGKTPKAGPRKPLRAGKKPITPPPPPPEHEQPASSTTSAPPAVRDLGADLDKVMQGLDVAKTFVRGVIDTVTRRLPDCEPLLVRFFGVTGFSDPNLDRIIATYRQILVGLDNVHGDLQIAGQEQIFRNHLGRKKPNVGGYTALAGQPGAGTITLILPVVRALGVEDCAAILIHEVGHSYVGLVDTPSGMLSAHAFQEFACGKTTADVGRDLQNARSKH